MPVTCKQPQAFKGLHSAMIMCNLYAGGSKDSAKSFKNTADMGENRVTVR